MKIKNEIKMKKLFIVFTAFMLLSSNLSMAGDTIKGKHNYIDKFWEVEHLIGVGFMHCFAKHKSGKNSYRFLCARKSLLKNIPSY